jgi:hypothetical protein
MFISKTQKKTVSFEPAILIEINNLFWGHTCKPNPKPTRYLINLRQFSLMI